MLLRYVILSLVRDEEMHGYRIKSAFEERLGRTWPLNFGQIYSTLRDLKRRDLISGRFESNGSHMGRWVYQATPRGRRSLATWLARKPRPPVPPRNEILVRLLTASNDDADANVTQLENQELVYRAHIEDLRRRRREVRIDGAPTQREVFARLAIDAAIYQADAHLKWLRLCRRTLAGSSVQPEPKDDAARDARPRRRRTRRVPRTTAVCSRSA